MNLQTYLKEHSKKKLIFDFDETIMWAKINWDGVQKQRYKYMFQMMPGIVKNDAGKAPSTRVDRAIKVYGKRHYERIMENETSIELENLSEFEPNPEMIEFIQKQRDNYDMYIWSSNTIGLIESGLIEHQIVDCFQKIISKDRVTLRKPTSYGFFKIFNPEEDILSDYLMIGNNRYADEGAAKNVGIDFFHVSYFDK